MNTGRPHGNAKYHLEKCRCLICRRASSAYSRNRTRAMAYGRWQPLVDAEPVREHARALGEFGIGWMRLARLAGVPRGSVSKLLYGDPKRGLAPSKRLLPKNAAAILAVEPTLDNLGARIAIDGTGTRRRLRALVAKGWPLSELARRLRMERSNFGRLITMDRLVSVGTHRATIALYDLLWRIDPAECGIPHRWIEHSCTLAVTRRWAPIGAWDDDTIDDPAAFPDWTGLCGTPQGRAAHRRSRTPVCSPCRDAWNAQRRTQGVLA